MVYPGEMGADEVGVGWIGTLIGVVLFARLVLAWRLAGEVAGRPRPVWVPAALVGTPIAAIVGIHLGLGAWADVYVQGDLRYRWQYDALGAAWVLGGQALLGVLGLDVVAEAMHRRNPAAAVLGAGAAAGLALAYLGGNVGDGPGWWVVLLAAGLATAQWLVVWWIVGGPGHALDRVVIGRHVPTAWRTAGLVVAAGAVLGRGVAGDWVSGAAMLADALTAIPAVGVLVAVELAVARLGPRPFGPRDPGVLVGGVLPALVYVTLAAMWVLVQAHPNPAAAGLP